MKKLAFLLCAGLLALTSCHDINSYYHPEESSADDNSGKGGEEYAAKFSNYSSISVNITSDYEGTYYALYSEYPYDDDGTLIGEPLLSGKSPISMSVNLPNHTEKLYLVGNGELREMAIGNVTVNDTKSATRAINDDIDIRDIVAAANRLFPEMSYNIRRSELYKCTDLQVKESSETGEFERANVVLTYLGDGGGGTPLDKCAIYMYTYDPADLATLTRDKCTFYGLSNNKVVEVTESEMKNCKKYIFRNSVDRNSNRRVDMGSFPKGVSIGFAFFSTRDVSKLKFSTPALNDNYYVGETIVDKGVNATPRKSKSDGVFYTDGKGDFKIERNVSNVFIQHYKDANGNEYNILGCDNTLPFEYNSDGSCSYDGDYNDLLVLVQTDPEVIEPHETIIGEEAELKSTDHGYYLFEDTYPNHGDYDYNDVVVEYTISHYANNTHVATVKLLAYGCSKTNNFGFNDVYGAHEVFSGIAGYMNVYLDEPYKDMKREKTVVLTGDISPYISNMNGKIEKVTYDSDTHPYVLDVPYVSSSKFRWCAEKELIDDVYRYYTVKNWYKTPKDATKVIKWY